MKKYLIWCSGTQLGEAEQVIEAETLVDAEQEAYDLAYAHLESYAGYHGIPEDSEEALEEAGYESFHDVVSEWMDYGAREFDGHMKFDVSEKGLEPKD